MADRLRDLVGLMAEYDAIAQQYRDSKRLPFREVIERYTLFEVLGDIGGSKVLDMACGDGFYTRLLRVAGASAVTGVDLSAEMIRLAELEEQTHPLGCSYVQRDAGSFKPPESVDLVVAMYLLNYARTAEQLGRFCQACHDSLRPGGRFVGVNDNVRNPPTGSGLWTKYGFERTCRPSPQEGDPILYTVTNQDGRSFHFENFYLKPDTYRIAFGEAGFEDFRWIDIMRDPSERGNSFWDDFTMNPPITAFSALRP